MYDFDNLVKCMRNIKAKPDMVSLNAIKNELNKLYRDATCSNVIYSNNDKLFFGMSVTPYVDRNTVNNLLVGKDEIRERVKKYSIDIDSQLLSMGFSSRELTAVILHEVGHLVTRPEPYVRIQDIINFYMTQTNDTVSVENVQANMTLLTFGVQETLTSMTSMFKRRDVEVLADSYAIECGFGKELEYVLTAISSRMGIANNHTDNSCVTLQWSLKSYKDMQHRRFAIVKSLYNAADITGSTNAVKRMKIVAGELKKYKSTRVLTEEMFFVRKGKALYSKLKNNQMKVLEQELFELKLRVKNVTVHEEALSIVRTINSNISIIEDYLNTCDDKYQIEKYDNLRIEYYELREKLSDKTTYDDSYYGLFVKTPTVKSRYEI